MCGRATLVSSADDIAELFDVEPPDLGPPRYNVAPTQPILTLRWRQGSDRAASRELGFLRWGLIPWWAKDAEAKKIASRCIQARAETAPRTPAFRDAFARQRCLVVIDGFFEWKTLADGRKIPHHVRRTDNKPFAIAGLWDSWRPKETEQAARTESCAVLTTTSAGTIRSLHDRMPLVVAPRDYDAWLMGTADEATRLLAVDDDVLTQRAQDLTLTPVSTWVNDVKHDDPRCLEPFEAPAQSAFNFR